MTKISVLMPVYNTPETICVRRWKAFFAQTCADFEFLILNDASTDDNVEKVINSYDDKRGSYWQNDGNLGISFVEKQIDRAFRGEYWRFDHDDVSLPERLEKQAADAHPEMVVGCWYRILGTENKVSRFLRKMRKATRRSAPTRRTSRSSKPTRRRSLPTMMPSAAEPKRPPRRLKAPLSR